MAIARWHCISHIPPTLPHHLKVHDMLSDRHHISNLPHPSNSSMFRLVCRHTQNHTPIQPLITEPAETNLSQQVLHAIPIIIIHHASGLHRPQPGSTEPFASLLVPPHIMHAPESTWSAVQTRVHLEPASRPMHAHYCNR